MEEAAQRIGITRDYDTLKGLILAQSIGETAKAQLERCLDRLYESAYEAREALEDLRQKLTVAPSAGQNRTFSSSPTSANVSAVITGAGETEENTARDG